jgi:hypothetical protein
MPMTHRSSRIPLAEAALALRLTRERVLRRIQTGTIQGGQEHGKWFVDRAALEAELGARESIPASAA